MLSNGQMALWHLLPTMGFRLRGQIPLVTLSQKKNLHHVQDQFRRTLFLEYKVYGSFHQLFLC